MAPPPPSTLSKIIPGLFQNNLIRVDVTTRRRITFSNLELSPDQIGQLVYPTGFEPVGFYILVQDELEDEYNLQVISFAKKSEYVYGIYFTVVGQAKYDAAQLRESKRPVTLSIAARMLVTQYIEMYAQVRHKTVVIGIHSDAAIASLQYSRASTYAYANLSKDGIVDPLPIIHLTGLSRNLRHIVDL